MEITKTWSNVDIMLIDQVLKNNLKASSVICDAGCGSGRNIEPFLQLKSEVWGFDPSINAIHNIKKIAKHYGANESNFHTQSIENNTLPTEYYDFVICNAVLHFCSDSIDFSNSLDKLWSLVKPKGILFCRFATDINWPDTSSRDTFTFLADRELIMKCCEQMNAQFIDPLKTTLVDQSRTMSTLVLKK